MNTMSFLPKHSSSTQKFVCFYSRLFTLTLNLFITLFQCKMNLSSLFSSSLLSCILLHHVVLLFLCSLTCCNGQEAPYYTTPTYAQNVDHRQNLCVEYQLVIDRNITLKNALVGKELNIALFDYQLTSDGTIDENKPPIGIRVMDELARRARFEYRNSFGMVRSPAGTETYDDVLYWGARVYDLLGEWFIHDLSRLENSIMFPFGW